MPSSKQPPNQDRLLQLIAAMEGEQVVMAVDFIADRYIECIPSRISREAPIPILVHEKEDLKPGGGANAVVNVAALGGRPLPLGVVGDDENGRKLRSILESYRVPTAGVLTRARYRTPVKTRIVAGARHAIKQQVARYDLEEHLQLRESERKLLSEVLHGWGARAQAAVLSDYGYGTVKADFIGEMRAVLGGNCPILGDSRYRLSDFKGLDVVTPNIEETERLVDRELKTDDPSDIEWAGEQLLRLLEARFVLITRGNAGMSLFTRGADVIHIPAHGTKQVADVTGAGDTVIAVLALALATGATALEAACLANYAGGVAVQRRGAATLSPDELADAVKTDGALLSKIRWDGS